MPKNATEREMLEALRAFDTPTITNVVATYPHDKKNCLGLYNPWETNWYTDASLRCIYPALGPIAGIAVTCVFGLPSGVPHADCASFGEVLGAAKELSDAGLPSIVVIKQDLPEAVKRKSGLSGGLLTAQMKWAGAVGVISDGPSRDIHEIRPMKVQYMLTGVTAGHGAYAVKAAGVPVRVCGMDVAPGEVIHMDENGAVKFPRRYLPQVLERAERLREVEAKQFEGFCRAQSIEELARIAAGIEG